MLTFTYHHKCVIKHCIYLMYLYVQMLENLANFLYSQINLAGKYTILTFTLVPKPKKINYIFTILLFLIILYFILKK